MKSLYVLAVLALLPFRTWAQTAQVDHIDIQDYGIYTKDRVKMIQDPTLVGGVRTTSRNVKFVSRTHTIDGKVGVNFGFSYTVFTKTNGATVELKFVTIFPKQGMHDPATDKTQFRNEYSRTVPVVSGQSVHHFGYTFDNDFEIVPGTWTFQIWSGDRKLAEQSFKVIRP